MIARIKQIMQEKALSPSIFADEIGVQRSAISHILSERNKPSLELVQKILLRFKDIDANWLIFGENKADLGVYNPAETDKMGLAKESSNLKVNEKDYLADFNKAEKLDKHKRVQKVVLLYSDGTFEEFTS
jgi:transcriptional regulator with XRE-family HTH domain